MKGVPFVDLRRLHEPIRPAIEEALRGSLQRGDFIEGAALGEFEASFSAFCGVSHGVGVASGMDALVLALEGLGVGPGDEVITAANTFIATVFAIQRTGARPVLVDCDDTTSNLDPTALEDAITPRTKAILPVHLYGRLANMQAIGAIAQARSLPVLEDAAQAHGATRDGKIAGGFGRAAAFSFYPSKNLGALGDGGAVVTDDPELAARLRAVRSYGQRVKNRHDTFGVNSRLDTLQAGVLKIKLERLPEWNRSRAAAAAGYRERLADLPLRLPEDEPGAHVYHLFVIRTPRRDELREGLAEAGIQSGIHYPAPVHLQPAGRELASGPGSFPVAEKQAEEVLSLPMFPGMREDELDRVADRLTELL